MSASLPISSMNKPSAGFHDLCQRTQRARRDGTARPGRLFKYSPEPLTSGARVARSNSASSMASAGSGGAGQPMRVRVAERARASNSRTSISRTAGRAMRREGVERRHAQTAGQQIEPREGKRELLAGAGGGDAQQFGIFRAQFDAERLRAAPEAAADLRPAGAGTAPHSRPARRRSGRPCRAPLRCRPPTPCRSATPWARRSAIRGADRSPAAPGRDPRDRWRTWARVLPAAP